MSDRNQRRNELNRKRTEERYQQLLAEGKTREAEILNKRRKAGQKGGRNRAEAVSKAARRRGKYGVMSVEEKIAKNSTFSGDNQPPHEKFSSAEEKGLAPSYNCKPTTEIAKVTTEEATQAIVEYAEREIENLEVLHIRSYVKAHDMLGDPEKTAAETQKMVNTYLSVEKRLFDLQKIKNFGLAAEAIKPKDAPEKQDVPNTAVQINNPEKVIMQANGHPPIPTGEIEPPPPAPPE